jgi:hypothetical protein
MSIVKGIEGQILINFQNGDEEIPFAETWQASLQTQQVDAGPFLNDNGKVYSFTTTRRVQGSFQITEESSSKSSVHTKLINLSLSGTYFTLKLKSRGGYQMIIPSALLSGFQITNAANDKVTISFDFYDYAGFSVTPNPI